VSASDGVILALDCGTSSTKAIALDSSGRIVATASSPVELQTPQPGWVEHSADGLTASAVDALRGLLQQVPAQRCVGLGLSNQRESLVLWDRTSGAALSPVISWQDRRARALCGSLADSADRIREISGLPLDPMFSAVKARWLLDTYDPERSRARAGALCLGTVDSWLTRQFTGRDVIEIGNASRTSLLDLSRGDWSAELLEIFNIPIQALPQVRPSTGDELALQDLLGLRVPLAGVAGDSHAALFAHAGWEPGVLKTTLGTGSSVMTLGDVPAARAGGLCRTIAWQLPGERPAVALEANILAAGATLVWLADLLETTPEALADEAAADTAVTMVPAFDGLAAPWWDTNATATISGLSLATGRAELARAALDSVLFQVGDVTTAVQQAGIEPTHVVVDGNMATNSSLMTRLASVIDTTVRVANTPLASAQGAAHLAGIGIGLWDLNGLRNLPRDYVDHQPILDSSTRERMLQQWRTALARSRMGE